MPRKTDPDYDPTTRFLEKHKPWVIKKRSEPHAFEPLPLSDEERKDHPVCKGACECQACAQPKSNRVHTKAFAKEYARAARG